MSKKIQFALFSPQAGQSWHQLEERAHRCEKLGFHSIWLVDHMWTGGMPDLDHHECLALMAGLAAKTEKIRIGTLVHVQLVSQSGAAGEDAHDDRSHQQRPARNRLWRGLDGRGVQGVRLRISRRWARGCKQFEEGLQIMKAMFSREARDVQRAALLDRRSDLQSQAGAEAASADHDWRQRRKGDAEAGREVSPTAGTVRLATKASSTSSTCSSSTARRSAAT